MKQPTDGPPILLFLMMFTGMLAIVVGLAALSPMDERDAERQPRLTAVTGAGMASHAADAGRQTGAPQHPERASTAVASAISPPHP